MSALPKPAPGSFGRPPDVGEPAPFFTAATTNVERYSIDAAAGRWMVLMLFGTLSSPASLSALERALRRRDLFNDIDAAFYGVTVDAADRQRGLIDSEPGVRFFWDLDRAVCRAYGLANDDYLHPALFLIDPAFRIAMAEPIEAIDLVLDRLEQELRAPSPADQVAPVLVLPRVLEPDLCRELIDYYGRGEPTASGFAIEVEGQTVTRLNATLKRRTDVNLNAEDYDGGELRFLEFGRRTYRPPTGGAAVFACGLLHEATPVTRGVRYAVVPFLYDEAGERLRQANLGRVGE